MGNQNFATKIFSTSFWPKCENARRHGSALCMSYPREQCRKTNHPHFVDGGLKTLVQRTFFSLCEHFPYHVAHKSRYPSFFVNNQSPVDDQIAIMGSSVWRMYLSLCSSTCKFIRLFLKSPHHSLNFPYLITLCSWIRYKTSWILAADDTCADKSLITARTGGTTIIADIVFCMNGEASRWRYLNKLRECLYVLYIRPFVNFLKAENLRAKYKCQYYTVNLAI